jgi:hypothetical protein
MSAICGLGVKAVDSLPALKLISTADRAEPRQVALIARPRPHRRGERSSFGGDWHRSHVPHQQHRAAFEPHRPACPRDDPCGVERGQFAAMATFRATGRSSTVIPVASAGDTEEPPSLPGQFVFTSMRRPKRHRRKAPSTAFGGPPPPPCGEDPRWRRRHFSCEAG